MIAPSGIRLPDFIIVGAMKAGTSSLHHILNRHDEIFMAGREIYFFDMDDVQQHPDFFLDGEGQWRFEEYKEDCNEQLNYYKRFFQHSTDVHVIGERSTTYMAAARAPQRIADVLPDVKLIFMLRDPVTRAYSHYWHLVNTGRASHNFESMLLHSPGTILQRGCYKQQIERYQKLFREDQLKFIIFEEFIGNVQSCIDDLCRFLGLRTSIQTKLVDTHRNVGTAPSIPSLVLRANWKNGKTPEGLYRGYVPTLRMETKKQSIFRRCSDYLSPIKVINMMVSLVPRRRYPPMADGVQRFLERLYARDNRGLGDLIGIDIERFWPYMRHNR
jgi:Sulfotransferase family